MFNLKQIPIFYLFGIILVITVGVYIYINLPASSCQVFAEQAQNFIRGRTDINTKIDAVYFNGKYYWPQGPFPSVLLVPFQLLFGSSFNQATLQPFLIATMVFILYKLARLKKFNFLSSLTLVYVYLFGSVIFGIITEPCYSFFAHTTTMVLLALLLWDLETKQRFLILGILSGLILATRPTAGLIIPLIPYLILRNKKDLPFLKIRRVLLFLLPILISIFLLLWFNNIRFQNPFETGYSKNNVGSYLNSMRSEGVFNISYIPTNIFYYFINSVQPVIENSTRLVFPYFTYSPYGLSFLIISPFFLYSLKSFSGKNPVVTLYWLTVFITLFILLTYYTTGWVQFGPRFTSDFMPVLYLLTLYGLKGPNLSQKQTLLILISSLINAYLLLTGFFIFKT